MTIKAKFSNSYKAKQMRIKRLPKLLKSVVSGATKKDLLGMKKIFHDGIKDNRLGLDALAESTIRSKKAKGYPKAKSPLYGAGDTEGDRSYANMLLIAKVKNGWKLRPSTRKHHSGNVTLKDLFMIHEHGALIKKKTKNGKASLIRIPPRPAFLIAYKRWLGQRKKSQKETSLEVKAAIREFINTGSKKKLKVLQDYEKREK